jgi:hypothetical protein
MPRKRGGTVGSALAGFSPKDRKMALAINSPVKILATMATLLQRETRPDTGIRIYSRLALFYKLHNRENSFGASSITSKYAVRNFIK